MSSAWGRIFYLYGPHEHPARLVASVVCSLLKGRPARCSDGRQIRDFLYVEDVADALVALLESEAAGPVNVASGNPVSVRDMVCRIADQIGREDLVRLGAIPTPKTDPPQLTADVNRLSRVVGWSPNYSLQQGLEKTVAWWEQQLRAK